MREIKTVEEIVALQIPQVQKERIALVSGMGEAYESEGKFLANLYGHWFKIKENGELEALEC